MKLSDAARYALGNLRRHTLRTALTVSGVSVGVGTLTLLVSLGSGLQAMVESQFMKAELVARIHVMRDGSKDQLLRGAFGRKKDGLPITADVVDELAKLPGVTSAWAVVQPLCTVELEGLLDAAQLEGLPTQALGENFRGALVTGRYWTEQDAGDVVVLPSSLLSDLGVEKAEDVVGRKVALSGLQGLRSYRRVEVPGPTPEDPPGYRFERPKDLKVVEAEVLGVYRSQDFGQFGRNVHCPVGLAERMQKASPFGQPGEGEGYQMAIVRVGSPDDIDRVAEEVEKRGFDALTVYDFLQPVRIVFNVFKVMLGMFGGIGLVVALFGIANTMVMAVLERTREIGVLKALGARNRDIRRAFLVEAASIGILGGGLGIAGAWALGQLINLIANKALEGQLEAGTWLAFFHVSASLAGGVLAMSALVAAAAGLLPALRAARLDPVVALRVE